MKIRTTLKTLFFSTITTGLLSLPAHSALISYSGTVEDCGGLCGIFTSIGQRFDASFEAPDGAGIVDYTEITNASISLSTPSGGSLAFINGNGLASSLLMDDFNNVIGGNVTIIATGATCGIQTAATLDFSSNQWQMSTYKASCGAFEPLASGYGAFTSNDPDVVVPLPAAAWLFATALGGLVAIKKKLAASVIFKRLTSMANSPPLAR